MRFPIALLLSLCLASTSLAAAELWTKLFEETLTKAKAGDAEAAYEIGIMYLKGQGVDADRGQADQWLKQAAAAGNNSASSKLARMAAEQDELNRNRQRAEAGDAEAQYETGMMYLAGKGVGADTGLAVTWLQKAAAQDNLKAVTRLGMLYLKGDGVPAAPERAVAMLARAAGSEVLAQYYLGEAYAEGLGVKRDYPQAIAWYQKAADNGFSRAAGNIIDLEEEMRMDERRRQRQALEEAAQEQTAAPEKAAPVAVAKAAPANDTTPAKDPRPTQDAESPAVFQRGPTVFKRDLRYLVSYNWNNDGKAANFLPSSLNACEMDKERLVCYSGDIEEISVGRRLRYRVKSIITPGSARDSFDVVYRNLVLDVEMLDVDSDPIGYGTGEQQGFKVKTGWSGEHRATCRFTTDRSVDCVKDGIQSMTALLGDTRAPDAAPVESTAQR